MLWGSLSLRFQRETYPFTTQYGLAHLAEIGLKLIHFLIGNGNAAVRPIKALYEPRLSHHRF